MTAPARTTSTCITRERPELLTPEERAAWRDGALRGDPTATEWPRHEECGGRLCGWEHCPHPCNCTGR
jgi:hypothetical protein